MQLQARVARGARGNGLCAAAACAAAVTCAALRRMRPAHASCRCTLPCTAYADPPSAVHLVGGAECGRACPVPALGPHADGARGPVPALWRQRAPGGCAGVLPNVIRRVAAACGSTACAYSAVARTPHVRHLVVPALPMQASRRRSTTCTSWTPAMRSSTSGARSPAPTRRRRASAMLQLRCASRCFLQKHSHAHPPAHARTSQAWRQAKAWRPCPQLARSGRMLQLAAALEPNAGPTPHTPKLPAAERPPPAHLWWRQPSRPLQRPVAL